MSPSSPASDTPAISRISAKRRLLTSPIRRVSKPVAVLALLAVAVAGLATVFALPASSQGTSTRLETLDSRGCNPNVAGGPAYVVADDLPDADAVSGDSNNLASDCRVLWTAFHFTWGGDQSHLPANHPLRMWGSSANTHISTWPGITIETVDGAQRVTGIDLSNPSTSNRGIDCSFESETNSSWWPRMTALKTLNLSGNNCSGSLPLFFADFSLTSLDLSGNSFSGGVPDAYTGMTSLTELLLQDNDLTGRLPAGFDNLLPTPSGDGNLTKLGICGNGLYGSISRSFHRGAPQAPELVDYPHSRGYSPLACQPDGTRTTRAASSPLNENDCTNGNFVDSPAVPGDDNDLMDDCQDLVRLHYDLAVLSSNEGFPSTHFLNTWGVGSSQKVADWDGVTVSTVAGVQRVTGLDLSGNNLSGSFPLAITRLLALKDLDLSDNDLSGPHNWEVLGRLRLETLDLSDNNFYEIPAKPLWHIWRARNANAGFTGGFVTSYTSVDLSNNNFATFPSNFTEMTALTNFDVSNNNMRTGAFPGNIGEQLTSLVSLDISNNRVSGGLPGNIGNIKTLETLNVSNNNLTGGLGSLAGLARSHATPGALETLRICGNSFTGALPAGLRDTATDAPDLGSDFPEGEYDPVGCQNQGDWYFRTIQAYKGDSRSTDAYARTKTVAELATDIGVPAGGQLYEWQGANQRWRPTALTTSVATLREGATLGFMATIDPTDIANDPDRNEYPADILDVTGEDAGAITFYSGWNIISMPTNIDRDSGDDVSFFAEPLYNCDTVTGVIAIARLSPQGTYSVELPCHPTTERSFAPLERINEGDAVFIYFRAALPVSVTWDADAGRYSN